MPPLSRFGGWGLLRFVLFTTAMDMIGRHEFGVFNLAICALAHSDMTVR